MKPGPTNDHARSESRGLAPTPVCFLEGPDDPHLCGYLGAQVRGSVEAAHPWPWVFPRASPCALCMRVFKNTECWRCRDFKVMVLKLLELAPPGKL